MLHSSTTRTASHHRGGGEHGVGSFHPVDATTYHFHTTTTDRHQYSKMCRMCIIRHLEHAIENTKSQLNLINAKSLELDLQPVNLCVPYRSDIPRYNGRRQFLFPGTTVGEAQSFATMLRLCTMILDNIRMNKSVTTRDLYYKDVALFRTQRVVVRYIERLVRLLEVPRGEMNVIASPNGLMAGQLTICLEGGDIIDVHRSNGATLIPVGEIAYVNTTTRPHFILVIEKEAVFSHLQKELQNGIIVTGKGFPDRATRNLLRALSIAYPLVPMYGLVDSDPHGILILRSYESGTSFTYEPEFHLNLSFLGVSILEYTQGLVPLTMNDMRVAMSTLRKDWIYENKYYECKQELQRGLFMGLKGEMNLLDVNQSERLSDYVKTKMKFPIGSMSEENTDMDETLIEFTQNEHGINPSYQKPGKQNGPPYSL